MATIVTALFNDPSAGQAAADDLRANGFGETAIRTVSPMTADAAAQALRDFLLSSADLAAFSEAVAQGGFVVAVQAEFGEAMGATSILEAHHPRQVTSATGEFGGLSHTAGSPRDHEDMVCDDPANDPAPFSRLFGWKLLDRDDPAPLSRALGWKVLSETDTPDVALTSDNAAPFSRALGLPVLTKGNVHGVALNSEDPAPFSRALGLRTLVEEDPAPLSRKAGWSTLLHDPAPLSRLLRLPVLIRD